METGPNRKLFPRKLILPEQNRVAMNKTEIRQRLRSQLQDLSFVSMEQQQIGSRRFSRQLLNRRAKPKNLMQLVKAVKRTTYVRCLANELGIKQIYPTIVHEDNDAVISFVENYDKVRQTKHFIVKVWYLQQQEQLGVFRFLWVDSATTSVICLLNLWDVCYLQSFGTNFQW